MSANVTHDAVIGLPDAMRHSKAILAAAQKLASAVHKARKKQSEEAQAREQAKRLREEVHAALKAVPDGDPSELLRIEKTIQKELIKANNEIDRAIEGFNKEEAKSEQAYADLLAVLTEHRKKNPAP